MKKINIYNFFGAAVGEKELPSEVFEKKAKLTLMQFVVEGLRANARQVLARAKTRGEVSGGGRKPWKQKGTGRARQGSIRSPLWKGGGVVFGPRPERNFKIKINKKIKKAAFCMALSEKVEGNALLLLENFDLSEAKTKVFAKVLKSLPLVGKKVLLIFSKEKDALRRASANLPRVTQENINEVNLIDILNANTVLTTPDAIDYWQKIYQK